MAHKVLGEKCGLVPIVSAIFTLLGVIVISRPPHLTGEEEFDLNSLVIIIKRQCLACFIQYLIKDLAEISAISYRLEQV